MYNWQLMTNHTTYEGTSATLHAAFDKMVAYARGKTERNFFVNGHHMNEEFGLWIKDGKVCDDNGEEFVPMNDFYALLAVPGEHVDAENLLSNLAVSMNSLFRPQPTRGSAPTNPSTLMSKGEGL